MGRSKTHVNVTSATSKYPVVAKRYRRSHDLHHDAQQHGRGNSRVTYSSSNPDEEDTVQHAYAQLQIAITYEHSFVRRFHRWWGGYQHRDVSVVLDHVLLGGEANASNHEELVTKGVTHICNCAAHQVENRFEGEFFYITLQLRDALDEDLMPFFQTVTGFLKRVELLRGRALIHCVSGISRSAALLIAYLMIDKRLVLRDAYNHVKAIRRFVQPNQAFRLQLAKYELMLFGASSVATSQDKDWDFCAWNEFKSHARLHSSKLH
ncbi:hypothetical protein Poli38472_012309 [Pythium oligandrum]|uniref:Uncharacterized protein n=1 Tax=Pythium oligandrum TaxID=41045 RepID=A0A8K1CRW1_PYTOL|nr:hypothetical protein Poli38472_012309 [Pythium oligandrum]|eukprot:TMW67193.1 hypothetical protein Poli38472_012309 [Pythium oligandrum]